MTPENDGFEEALKMLQGVAVAMMQAIKPAMTHEITEALRPYVHEDLRAEACEAVWNRLFPIETDLTKDIEDFLRGAE